MMRHNQRDRQHGWEDLQHFLILLVLWLYMLASCNLPLPEWLHNLYTGSWPGYINCRGTTGRAREEEKEGNVEFSSVRSAGAALSVTSRKETFINRQPVSLLPNAPVLSNDPEWKLFKERKKRSIKKCLWHIYRVWQNVWQKTTSKGCLQKHNLVPGCGSSR